MLKTDNCLAEGSIMKNLLLFSFPLILSNLLQAAFNVTDMIVVSHYKGSEALSAIGIGGLITYLIINGATGLSGGLTLLIGKLYGAKKEKEIRQSIGNFSLVFGILSVIISVLVMLGADVWLKALATPQEAFEEARRYVRIAMSGLPLVFVYNGVAAVSKGLGDGKLPLLIIAAAASMNAGWDMLLIAGLGLGAGFTAISNILSEGVAAVIGIAVLFKEQPLFRLQKEDFVFDSGMIKELAKLGAPLAVLNITATLSFMLLTYIVNQIGGDSAVFASGAHAIATKYNGMALLPARAVSLAIAAMVSQNLGSQKPERNRKTMFTGLCISLVLGLLITAVSFFFPDAVFHAFGTKEETIQMGRSYMKIMSFDYMIVPFAVSAYGLADGYGKTYATMTINMIASVGIRAPAAYLFGIVFSMGMPGIGFAIITASAVSAIASWGYLLIIKEKPLIARKCRHILQ